MSHEPGRERHMTYVCEQCKTKVDCFYSRTFDMYICDECFTELNDAMEDDDDEVAPSNFPHE